MNSENKLVRFWLFSFCILVILMISVGGITRLTRSGLSIVEWKPISGIIPPITETEWQIQFDLYKNSPEFLKINSHFELNDYKQIFIWEYLHRVLGRIIFLFVLIPGFFLWRKKQISGLFVLGMASFIAFQGLIGWLMVRTGLNVKPHVSPYMLAIHFFLALGALHIAAYQYYQRGPSFKSPLTQSFKFLYKIFGGLLALQVFWGCLVGGLKAGLGFNTYPLMNGNFFPEGGFVLNPIFVNFFENHGTVQWVHRWLGLTTGVMLLFAIKHLYTSELWGEYKESVLFLLGIVVIQIILGILTIIYAVPIFLAATHQVMAALLVLAYFRVWFKQPR